MQADVQLTEIGSTNPFEYVIIIDHLMSDQEQIVQNFLHH